MFPECAGGIAFRGSGHGGEEGGEEAVPEAV
jgi:hypothetical protein